MLAMLTLLVAVAPEKWKPACFVFFAPLALCAVWFYVGDFWRSTLDFNNKWKPKIFLATLLFSVVGFIAAIPRRSAQADPKPIKFDTADFEARQKLALTESNLAATRATILKLEEQNKKVHLGDLAMSQIEKTLRSVAVRADAQFYFPNRSVAAEELAWQMVYCFTNTGHGAAAFPVELNLEQDEILKSGKGILIQAPSDLDQNLKSVILEICREIGAKPHWEFKPGWSTNGFRFGIRL